MLIIKCIPLVPQWCLHRECRHQGILGEYAKLDEPFEKSGWTEASGDVLQRGHDQISGLKYLLIYEAGVNPLSACHLLFVSGVSRRHPVHSSEPGSELATWCHQHRSQNRLQIQHRGPGSSRSPTRHPLPSSRGRRRGQTPGHDPACHLVRTCLRTSEWRQGNSQIDSFTFNIMWNYLLTKGSRAADDTVENPQPLT